MSSSIAEIPPPTLTSTAGRDSRSRKSSSPVPVPRPVPTRARSSSSKRQTPRSRICRASPSRSVAAQSAALRQARHAFEQVQAKDDPAGIGSIEDSPDGVRTGSGLEADHDGGALEIDQRVKVVLVLQAGIDPEMQIQPGESAIERQIGSLPEMASRSAR